MAQISVYRPFDFVTDDTLMAILELLDITDRARCTVIDKRWCSALLSPSIWKSIKFCYDFKSALKFKRVDVENPVLHAISRSVVNGIPTVETLDIHLFEMGNLHSVSVLPRLKMFRFRGTFTFINSDDDDDDEILRDKKTYDIVVNQLIPKTRDASFIFKPRIVYISDDAVNFQPITQLRSDVIKLICSAENAASAAIRAIIRPIMPKTLHTSIYCEDDDISCIGALLIMPSVTCLLHELDANPAFVYSEDNTSLLLSKFPALEKLHLKLNSSDFFPGVMRKVMRILSTIKTLNISLVVKHQVGDVPKLLKDVRDSFYASKISNGNVIDVEVRFLPQVDLNKQEKGLLIAAVQNSWWGTANIKLFGLKKG